MVNRSRLFLLSIVSVLVLVFGSGVVYAQGSVPRAVIIAQNSGTEITDLLVPFAVLAAAAVNVEIVATGHGPVNMMNGLELLGLRTIAELDLDAIDLVVVPAVHEPDEPALIEWLALATNRNVMVASICDGVEVLASAGVLDGHKATGHFYSKSRRKAKHPGVDWVENTRYVHDGNIVSTAGVSASAPASIYLAKLLVGEGVAHQVAKDYGIDITQGKNHRTADFSVGLREVYIGARNILLGLRKKKYNLLVDAKSEEFSLAFVVDALGRTYRASVGVDAPNNTFLTKRGLKIRGKPAYQAPDFKVDLRSASSPDIKVATIDSTAPHDAIKNVFEHIELVYGRSTAKFVGMQLELPMEGLVRRSATASSTSTSAGK